MKQFSLKAIACASLVLLLPNALAAGYFRDVAQSHVNADAIDYVKAEGIVQGYDDGTYRPGALINRAEFLKIAAEAFDDPAVINRCKNPNTAIITFTDVKMSDWYAPYVCAGTDHGVRNPIGGYPDGTFRGGNNISFVEAAKILTTYQETRMWEAREATNDPDTSNPFYVAATSNEWYAQDVTYMGKVNAIPTTITRFDQQITRGEMAEMIYRMRSPVTNKPSQTFESLKANASAGAFISITSHQNGQVVYEQPFQLSGTTSPNCSKITAHAVNDQYGVNDTYVLATYKKGDTTFKYGIAHEWHNLDVGKNVFTLTATCDSGNPSATIEVYFEAGGGVEMGKPVIYLYPEHTQQVSVLPQPEGGVTVSEPALGNGWTVMAHPDGTLVNADGTSWSYLFWEGFAHLLAPQEGFVVARGDLDSFFSTKLAYLGLNDHEIADFKDFWLKQMSADGYYVIHFIDQAQLDAKAPLAVSPAPQTSIRVFFNYEFSKTPVTVPEQQLQAGKARNGFTLIEWGGQLYR